MKIFSLKNKNSYSFKCLNPNCEKPSKIIISLNYNNFILKGECMGGHYFSKNLNFIEKDAIFQKVQKVNSISFYCNECCEELNEHKNKYKCDKCKEIFCNKCIDSHLKSKKINNKTEYVLNYNSICKIHNKKYNYFCNDCKMNICDDCWNLDIHKSHEFKNFLKLKTKEFYKPIIEKNNIEIRKKIKLINKIFDKIKKDINEFKIYEGYDDCNDEYYKRNKNLKNYLEFLLDVNNIFLKNFDYELYDYYNYENYYYFYNYINNELKSEEKKYKNYIIFGKLNNFIYLPKKNDIIDISDIGKYKTDKMININNNGPQPFYIEDYTRLYYFKENLFLLLTSKKLYLLEFKDFSFYPIYELLVEVDIFFDHIKIGQYNNTFFLIRYSFYTYCFEYNMSEKKINLREIINIDRYHLTDIIDTKNRNIIITNGSPEDKENKLILRKNGNEQVIADKTFYGNLFYINDNILVVTTGDNYYLKTNIYFFNSENYEFIKSIDCKLYDSKYSNSAFYIDKVGKLNDKFFFVSNCHCRMKIIDSKYLEVVQYIEDMHYSININNQYLLEIDDGNLYKKYFNFEEGTFKVEKIKVKNGKININMKGARIIAYDNSHIILLGKQNLTLIKI